MGEAPKRKERAVRVAVGGDVQGDPLLSAVAERARELGLSGWVRHGPAGALLVHAEGEEPAVSALLGFFAESPAGSSVEAVEHEAVKPEGHEQFAVRGVSAGRFELTGSEGEGFELRLEVGGSIRAWALPKGPSMDPAVKRMAFAAKDEPRLEAGECWDEGEYEQGGRVPWPEAIDRGHAVFVLHGERLRGGFALQRIRKPNQWLLVKRADDDARRGSEVVAEAKA